MHDMKRINILLIVCTILFQNAQAQQGTPSWDDLKAETSWYFNPPDELQNTSLTERVKLYPLSSAEAYLLLGYRVSSIAEDTEGSEGPYICKLDAIKIYEEGLKHCPQYGASFCYKIGGIFATEEWGKPVYNPDSAKHYYKKGAYEYSETQAADSCLDVLRDYKTIVEKYKSSILFRKAYFILADSYSKENPQKMIDLYLTYICSHVDKNNISQEDKRLWLLVGQDYFNVNKYQESIKYLEEFVLLWQNNSESLFDGYIKLCEAYYKIGDKEKAKIIYAKAENVYNYFNQSKKNNDIEMSKNLLLKFNKLKYKYPDIFNK